MPRTAFCEDAGGEGCALVDITVAAVGPDGRVALASGRDAVVQFDSTGGFVRRIGKRGRGPGEYRSVMALSYESAAALSVFDAGTWRIVRFDSAGRARSTDLVEPPRAVQDAAFGGGRLVFFSVPGGRALGDTVTARFLGVDASGSPSVELGVAPARALAPGDGSLVPLLPPFTARPRWSVAPDGGIYFAEGEPLRIVRADGPSPRIVVEMDVAPPEVTSAELDSARAVLLRLPRMGGRGAATARAQAEAAIAGARSHHPMIGALVAVHDGMIWARETKAAVPDSVRWNGFAADGRPIGFVLLPVKAHILAGDADRVLIVSHDADDVPMARWYAIGHARPLAHP